MILFLKKRKNKEYNINAAIQSIDIEPVLSHKERYGDYSSQPLIENKKQAQELFLAAAHAAALAAIPETKKEYPLIVKHQFPRWLRDGFDTSEPASLLIKITEYYYEWLTNIPETLNGIDVFYMDKNYDIDRTNSEFLKHLANTYINSLPPEQIITDDTGGFVTLDAIRNFISNIKINLYQIKSTTKSFLYAISELLEIQTKKIKITYPKQYMLRLNGGRFPWMSSYGDKGRGEYSLTQNYYPSLGGSILNRSVIQDNNFWQEYSYLLDTINEDNATKYEQVLAPLLHPAGMKYFFETGAQFFENITDVVTDIVYERPIIGNYGYYTIQDSMDYSPVCMGCSDTPPYPVYTFPSWDCDIKQKITNGTYPPTGLTFGSIYIGDFLELRPCTGLPYPNSTISDCTVAEC